MGEERMHFHKQTDRARDRERGREREREREKERLFLPDDGMYTDGGKKQYNTTNHLNR
jgi:hypothetical protein